MADTKRLVLLRHGESVWNVENRFTGWTDVDLSEQGRREAAKAAELLRAEQIAFDCAFTSVLKRAIRTLWIVMDGLDQMWIPVERSYKLNERHYGALQGLNKGETAAKYGEAQVKVWRRSYDIPPPALADGDPRLPELDPRYRTIDRAALPRTESLKETLARVVPFWEAAIAPRLKAGERVLVVAHGNSLRALVKHLDGMSDSEIVELNIPTGVPLVYELDASLRAVSHRYLGDEAEIRAAAQKVAAQGARA